MVGTGEVKGVVKAGHELLGFLSRGDEKEDFLLLAGEAQVVQEALLQGPLSIEEGPSRGAEGLGSLEDLGPSFLSRCS